MSKIKGSCLCGQVSYQSSADEPSMMAICHCPDCQKQNGAAFSINVLVPTASIKFEGKSLAQYIVNGDSGTPVTRNFCNNCGSPLSTELDAFGNLAAIKAGTLEDSSWVKPSIQIWCDAAQPWGVLDNSIECKAENPI